LGDESVLGATNHRDSKRPTQGEEKGRKKEIKLRKERRNKLSKEKRKGKR